jgi:spore maturation protein SpmA
MSTGTPKTSAINAIWIFLILSSVFVALFTGRMEEVSKASFESAKRAVELAIGLVGAMALWLGLVKVAEEAGLMALIAGGLRPLMTRLFPDVPPEHPAMGAMVMNMAANVMGLGNAATPLGIKAMQELDKLNPRKGEATDAMCLFLAINTSSVTVLPLGVIAVRAAAGASDPGSIFLPGLLATTFNTIVAIIAAKVLGRIYARREDRPREAVAGEIPEAIEAEAAQAPAAALQAAGWRRLILPLYSLLFLVAAGVEGGRRVLTGEGGLAVMGALTHWLIPFLMGILVVYGVSRRVSVYETVCEGAKEGFSVALRIIPFLVAILVAIGMFRASGALDLFTAALAPLTNLIGMPADTVPMALVRPLSGSGAFGIMSDLVASAPDSLSAYIASIMQGTSDTTFYILAVYFGAVQVTRVRYAVIAGLVADATGVLASVALGQLFYR